LIDVSISQTQGEDVAIEKRKSVWGWCVVFFTVLGLYLFTLAPDVAWQDQGDYQLQAARCSLNRPGDVVRVHPLYILTAHGLGRLGFWSYAYSANLVNAIFTAAASANIFLLTYWLVRFLWPAVLAALVCSLAHSVWFLGVQAQTYGMSNAAMTGGLIFLLAYLHKPRAIWLSLMGLVFGLGISAHMMSQLGFLVIMIWLVMRAIQRQVAWRAVLLTLVCWTGGAVLLWVVMVIEYQRSGELIATIQSAIWGRWESAVFNLERLSFLIKRSLQFFILNFPTPLVLLVIVGVYASFKHKGNATFARLLLSMTVFYAFFAIRYDVPNQNNFFLPMYLLISIYIGWGYRVVFRNCTRLGVIVSLVCLAAIPPTYAGMAAMARDREIPLGTRRHIPYRDVYQYYLVPWQQNQTGPRRLVTEMFEKLPIDAVILADTTTIPPLKYVQEIEGQRRDIRIFAIFQSLDTLSRLDPSAENVFTLSNIRGYYPPWVERTEWLKPFALSDTEMIYKIDLSRATPHR